MKISISAESQEEFDSKREDLIKSIAGSKFNVEIRPKGESLATDKKEPYYFAQAEMLKEWEKEFQIMISDIKKEISEVIDG